MKTINRKRFIECQKCLLFRKKILEFIMFILTFVWVIIIFYPSKVFPQQHPTVHNDLVFFVETDNISTTNHIAYCESDFCLNHPNSEGAIITEQYCDVSNSCNEGCVRRWLDQSNYTPSGGFNPPEYTNGRNFGQDDAEKPCYISNCINNKPCVGGGGPYGELGDIDNDGDMDYEFPQDKYFELQISDFINLPNDFSIFLLAKPIDQTSTGDWFYFGQSSHFLRHDVSTNNVQLRVPGNFATTISEDDSINLNQWQLIEIHRDTSNKITFNVDGIDKTRSSNIILPGNFQIGYLLSNFKTKGQLNQTAMYGDIASFLVYERNLSNLEKIDVWAYFQSNYLDETLIVVNHNLNDIYIDFHDSNVLKIFNPNSKYLKSIVIHDSLGREVFKNELNNEAPLIELQNHFFSKGLYYISLMDENGNSKVFKKYNFKIK